MKATTVIAAACLAFSAAAHAEVSKKDQTFITKAAAGGLFEVQAGKLAQSKGTSDEVKAYGAMLVKDHSAANEELKALASSKGATVPAALPKDKQSKLDKINKADAKSFDSKFIEEVGRDAHKTDISLFEKASKDADDAELKAFAAKTLPTLQAHKDHADGLKQAHKR